MNHDALLEDTIDALLADHCPPTVVAAAKGSWSPVVWQQLTEAGLAAVGVAEKLGGAGGSLMDAAAVVRCAARHAAPVPLAETLFPAAYGCAAAGLRLPSGPVTVAADYGLTFTRRGDAVVVAGEVPRVPFARVAERILLIGASDDRAEHMAALVDPDACELMAADNLAAEPRDDLTVRTELPDSAVATTAEDTLDAVWRQGALGRAVQIAGALERLLELTADYAGEREQFGRPIARFQAVAQMIARLAGEVTATRAAVDAAVDATARGNGGLATAAAKARASAAVGPATRIAHQVHGAIGFTEEHRLHHFTQRLWAWREEYGSDEHWSAVVGDAAIKAGADGLWPVITSSRAEGSLG